MSARYFGHSAFVAFIIVVSICGYSFTSIAAESSGATSRKRTAPSSASSTASSNKKTPTTAGSGVAATIRTDGALIYSKPDFDADILATLSEGQTVRVSKATTGEVAKFHKVRAGPVLGYIAEIDVQIEGATKKRTHKRGEKKQAKKKKDDGPQDPMMFSRFVGILIGQTSFLESVQGRDSDESLLVYGMKVTGPDVVLDGPIMDLNIALHYGAPTYYDRYSVTKPTGFVLWVDPLVLLPFINAQNHMVYLGAGPLLVLSSFKYTEAAGGLVDATSLKLGLSFELGFGFRIEKVAARIEGVYYLEHQSYKGVRLSVQSQF